MQYLGSFVGLEQLPDNLKFSEPLTYYYTVFWCPEQVSCKMLKNCVYWRMQLALLTVGKCKQAPMQAAARDYADRLKHYVSLQQIEVREERGAAARAQVLEKEGQRLLQALPERTLVVALDPAGKTCTSKALAKRLSNLALSGQSRLAFLIGGAFGLSSDVLNRADWRLSLSPLTFPHELARVILLEQLYRAYTIIRGENYHK